MLAVCSQLLRHCYTSPNNEINLVFILNNPAALQQCSNNFITGKLFGVLVVHEISWMAVFKISGRTMI